MPESFDLYRAHKLILARHSEPNLQKAFKEMVKQCAIPIQAIVSQQLKNSLFQAQKTILIIAVDSDLGLFEKSKALYVNLEKSDEEMLFGILDDPEAIERFKPAGQARRNHAEAYDYYCKSILGEGFRIGHLLNESSRYLKLLKRNPLAKKLLDQSLDNFTNNVRICLERVSRDKQALETCFLGGGSIQSISGITATGSDSHKGGKQVLLLDFNYRMKDSGSSRTKRIVYKPSDVEFDYRIAGANTEAIKTFLDRHSHEDGYATPAQSLYELLDEKAFDNLNEEIANEYAASPEAKQRMRRLLKLPTYGILPRNPGSKLKSSGGTLDIRSSYGYIEFLIHQPKPNPARPPSSDTGPLYDYLRRGFWRAHPDPDWITKNPDDAVTCFRLWGRLAAISCLFLQTDLHRENRRLRQLRPHLIDLENALVKPISLITSTGINASLDMEVHRGLTGYHALPGNGGSGRPISFHLGTEQANDWATDQLYIVYGISQQGAAIQHPKFNQLPQTLDFARGIQEAVSHLAGIRTAITAWTSEVNLNRVVVRNVVQPTAELVQRLQKMLRSLLGNHNTDDPDGTIEEILARRLKSPRDLAVENWAGPGGTEDPYRREYALEIPEYNGTDFKNLDVPSYYRRVGERKLMTSSGKPVRYREAFFQDYDGEDLLPFDEFHPDTGMQLLEKSLTEKLPTKVKDQRMKLDEFLKGKVVSKKAPRRGGVLPDIDVAALFKR